MDKARMQYIQKMKEQYVRNRLKFTRGRRENMEPYKLQMDFGAEQYIRYDAEVRLLEDILKVFKMYDENF